MLTGITKLNSKHLKYNSTLKISSIWDSQLPVIRLPHVNSDPYSSNRSSTLQYKHNNHIETIGLVVGLQNKIQNDNEEKQKGFKAEKVHRTCVCADDR